MRMIPGKAQSSGGGMDAQAIEELLKAKQDVLPFAVRFAKVTQMGELTNALGVKSVTRVSTGIYDVTFLDVGAPDYAVFAATHGVSSDPNVTITNETSTSCRVNIASGDNGDSADTPIDKDFSFILLRSAI